MTRPSPRAEAARLDAIRALRLVGAAPDAQLAAACRTAVRLFDAPIALVSLIDEDRQWLAARCGLDLESLPRGAAPCAHLLAGDATLVVEDATADPRFRDGPHILGAPGMRFYAGAPLALEPGLVVGTLCVMDTTPRRFPADAVDALRDLAEMVAGRLRLHRAQAAAEASDAARRASEGVIARQKLQLTRRTREIGRRRALLRHTVESMDQGLLMVDGTGVIRVWNQRALDLLGLPASVMKGSPTFESIRRHQWEQGEFATTPAALVSLFGKSGLQVDELCYERERPNGTVLEVRTVALPDGAAVRTYTDATARKRAAAELAASESRYRSLAEALPQKVYVTDRDGRITYANAHVTEYFGEGIETIEARSRLRHPDDAPRLEAARARALRDGTGIETIEARLRRAADGAFRWHRLQMTPIRRGADGRVEEWLHTMLDIDDIIRAERDLHEKAQALRVTNDRLQLALETSGVGLWDWDVATGAVWASDGSRRLLGSAADGHAPTFEAWAALVHPDDLPAAWERLRIHLAGKTPHLEAEYRIRRDDASWRWIQSRGRVVARDRNGRATRMIGVHSDITERKEAERREAHRARHDALTGLPNRTLLDERLAQALWAFERQGRPVAVLCLDLDRFKSVNDMLGHAVGDALLSEVARRLRAAVRAQDTVARLGGDEFAVVQVGVPQPEGARALAARLIESLAEPMRIGEHEICVGTSIGIALADRDCRDPKALLLNADVALYRAKDEERNAFRLYEPEMDAAAADRRALELDLRGALARREFTLHLQPVLTLESGAVSGYEALVRWRHPTRGLVSPGEFIPICEQTGMIAALGDWVLREACVIAAGWPDPVRIAVNVSAVQLRRADFTAGVVSALAHAGLAPHRLELEVTETVLMQDGERVLGTLRALRELGVRVALDDFGTGYSSLSYLSRFTFDKIKIDRSFVSNIEDGDTAAIVRAVVDLGARWGSAITAEGIETSGQLERVRAEGCHEAQGYYIGMPRPAEDWLREARRAHAARSPAAPTRPEQPGTPLQAGGSTSDRASPRRFDGKSIGACSARRRP